MSPTRTTAKKKKSPKAQKAAAPADGMPCPEAQQAIKHPFLKMLVGRWTTTYDCIDPAGNRQQGTAKSKISYAVDDTALVEEYSSKMMGQVFAGIGVWKETGDGDGISCWWLDNMSPEPARLSGTATASNLDVSGEIPGMGTMRIVAKKVSGGFDWNATMGGQPMMTQKYRKAR